MQASVAIRNAILNVVESTIGTAPILRGRTGAAPANIATASSGTVLFEMTLPSDWLADASSGAKVQAGTWQDLLADASGTLGHWEIVASDGTTRCLQGTVGVGSGELQVLTLSIVANAPITITNFTLTAGNA